MAFQYSTAARNASLDALFGAFGTTPTLKLWTGSIPANCAAADAAGTVVATIVLPNPFMASASGGAIAATNIASWADASADNAGTVTHFRIYQGATCHCQGTVTATGGGGDLTMDNPTVNQGQALNFTSFSVTAGGA